MLVRFIKDFLLGMRSLYEAVVMIFEHWLWLYFLLPILFSVAIYFGGESMFHQLKNINIQTELQNIEFKANFTDIRFEGFPTDSDEMKILVIALKMIVVVISLKLSKYIILILMAPVITILSARTEYLLTGNKYPFSISQFSHDLYRGINFAIRNMFRQLVIIVMWYLLTLLFPVMDKFTFPFVFCVGSYYYGSSMIDYTNERRRLSLEESVRFIRKNAGLAMSIGMMFSTLFFIAYIGIIFAPVIGIIAATYAMHQKVDLSKNEYAEKTDVQEKKESKKEYEDDEWG